MAVGEGARFPLAELEARVAAALRQAGASEPSLQAATKAMLHASRVGIDSHGIRLVAHYCAMMAGGRLNKNPQLKVDIRAPGSAMVDGDDGLGHYAAYKAVEVGCELARVSGVAGVGIAHSSHLGAAGAYALRAPRRGSWRSPPPIPIPWWRCMMGRHSFTAPIRWPSPRRCRGRSRGCWTWRPPRSR